LHASTITRITRAIDWQMQDTHPVVLSDDEFAPVAYLKCGTWRVEPKPPASSVAPAVVHIVTDEEASAAVPAATKHIAAPHTRLVDDVSLAPLPNGMVFLQARTAHDVTAASALGAMSVADEATVVLESIDSALLQRGLDWGHVTMMGVYLTNMADFGAVNAVYSAFLPIRSAPRYHLAACARICSHTYLCAHVSAVSVGWERARKARCALAGWFLLHRVCVCVCVCVCEREKQ